MRIVWEGTQFRLHSLALVNRELGLELIRAGHELSILPYEADEFGPQDDPRFCALAECIHRPLSGPTDIHVRHRWPPDLAAPAEGHWVTILPWDYGSLPRAWIEPLTSSVDDVWVYSNHVRDGLIRSGLSEGWVHTVPVGVDVARFHPGVHPLDLSLLTSSARAEDLNSRFKFLFVGGTIYRKGIDLLVKAYRLAFEPADDVCLIIKDVGSGSFYRRQSIAAEIRALAADPGLPCLVLLTQDLPAGQLAGLYTTCDCVVHPYRAEGFGLPIAEAMACARPVIVPRYGACLDFCNDESTYLVAAQEMRLPEKRALSWETIDSPWLCEVNVDDLAACMRQVYEHRDQARDKGQRAATHIRDHVTWSHAARVMLDRMDALMKRPIRRFSARGTGIGRASGRAGSIPSTPLPPTLLAKAKTDPVPPPPCAMCGSERTYLPFPGRQWRGEPLSTLVACESCGCSFRHPAFTLGGLPVVGGNASLADVRRSLKDELLYFGAWRWKGYPVEPRPVAVRNRILAYLAHGQLRRIPAWKPDGRLLDVGCGTGEYLRLMRSLGWRATGVVATDEQARLAAAVSGAAVIVSSQVPLEVASDSLDVVTLWDIVHRTGEPQSLLAEMKRVLCPGGDLLLKVPNMHSLPARIFGASWSECDLARDLWCFSPQALRQVVERAGFEVRDTAFLSTPASLASSLAYAEDGILGLRYWTLPGWLVKTNQALGMGLAGLSNVLAAGDSIFLHAVKPDLNHSRPTARSGES